jgi:hypothetical protein
MSTPSTDPGPETARPFVARPHSASSMLDDEIAHRVHQRLDRSRRREAAAEVRLRQLTGARIRDGHFGHPLPRRLSFLYDQLAAQIDDETLRGATRHRRTPAAVRAVPAVIAILDWVVLVPYGADILNADLDSWWTLRAVAAGLLALLGSGAAYVLFTQTGSRLRGYRTELGDVAWRTLGPLGWIMAASSLIMAAALAMLMFLRVIVQVGLSPDPTMAADATVIAVLFGCLSALANLAVVLIHLLDGSVRAAELRRAGQLLRRRERAVYRTQRRALRAPAPIPGPTAGPGGSR